MLDAWREQHADRLDPIRFHFIEALERRAAQQSDEVQRILDDRLSGLLDSYADDLAGANASVGNVDSATTPCAPAHGPLGELVSQIASHAAMRDDDVEVHGVTPPQVLFPELGALDEFRKIWSGIRTESQWQQSLKPVPANAGPLNSSALVHRSIALMRELSPGYLQHFLSYADDLLWMEQMNNGAAPPAKDATRAASIGKRARSKPRGRRE